MKEEWKDIYFYDYLNEELVDWRGMYQASNEGRIKSLERKVWNGKGYRTVKEKILSPAKTNNRYFHVNLQRKQSAKTYLVHKLVCGTFNTNPNGYKYVNHKNENIFDNRACNLEWCSIDYNNNYGTLRERMAAKQSMPVKQYDMDWVFIKEYPSLAEAGRQVDKSPGHLYNCCIGKTKSAGGYRWSFA